MQGSAGAKPSSSCILAATTVHSHATLRFKFALRIRKGHNRLQNRVTASKRNQCTWRGSEMLGVHARPQLFCLHLKGVRLDAEIPSLCQHACNVVQTWSTSTYVPRRWYSTKQEANHDWTDAKIFRHPDLWDYIGSVIRCRHVSRRKRLPDWLAQVLYISDSCRKPTSFLLVQEQVNDWRAWNDQTKHVLQSSDSTRC